MFDPLRLLASLFERLFVWPLRRIPSQPEARGGAGVIPFPNAARARTAGDAHVEDCD
jgi:hypothetical protein